MKHNIDSAALGESGLTRTKLALIIVMLYLFPIVLLSAYSLGLMPSNSSWNIFSIGLLSGFSGSGILYVLICQWERKIRFEKLSRAPIIKQETLPKPLSLDEGIQEELLNEWQINQSKLLAEIQAKEMDLQRAYQDQEQCHQHKLLAVQELEIYKKSVQDQFQQKDRLLKDFQQTIEAQNEYIEQQRQQIAALESREKDLSYELKTLLHVTNLDHDQMETRFNPPYPLADIGSNEHVLFEAPAPYVIDSPETEDLPEIQIHTPEAATIELRRCIDIATKMTGAQHSGSGASRLQVDNYALDLRRLCDSLRGDNTCIVLLFSQKENKLLFANNQVKNVLGWTPEKFVQSFSEIIQESSDEWKKGISMLNTQSEARIRLSATTKANETAIFYCHLGAIQTGLFPQHVIAVLYPFHK
jgi:hypothetical protein